MGRDGQFGAQDPAEELAGVVVGQLGPKGDDGRGAGRPQPPEHRPAAKAYVPPSLKVYGKAVDLTAAETGPVNESDLLPAELVCNPSCHP